MKAGTATASRIYFISVFLCDSMKAFAERFIHFNIQLRTVAESDEDYVVGDLHRSQTGAY